MPLDIQPAGPGMSSRGIQQSAAPLASNHSKGAKNHTSRPASLTYQPISKGAI